MHTDKAELRTCLKIPNAGSLTSSKGVLKSMLRKHMDNLLLGIYKTFPPGKHMQNSKVSCLKTV